MNEEIRVSNEKTGAMKGRKNARFELLPPRALQEVAEQFAAGAVKYPPHNWREGLDFGLLFGAMQRHAWAWWDGEDVDEETGKSHLAAVCFHAMALMTLLEEHPELDDRYKPGDGRGSDSQ